MGGHSLLPDDLPADSASIREPDVIEHTIQVRDFFAR